MARSSRRRQLAPMMIVTQPRGTDVGLGKSDNVSWRRAYGNREECTYHRVMTYARLFIAKCREILARAMEPVARDLRPRLLPDRRWRLLPCQFSKLQGDMLPLILTHLGLWRWMWIGCNVQASAPPPGSQCVCRGL